MSCCRSRISSASRCLIMTLMVGGTVRLVSKYDPAALARAIAEEGITILNGVPATYQRLLEYKAVAGLRAARPRLVALDRGRRRAARSGFEVTRREGVRPAAFNGYGITECSPGISGRALRCAAQRPGGRNGAAGRRGPDQDTSTAFRWRSGEVGELHVRGRNVMRGYYRAPDLTAKAIDQRGLVQYRRSRALRWRLPLHRRPHQGNDHPFGLQRLSGRGRGGAEFAQGRRAIGRGRPHRRWQRRDRRLCAAAAGVAR